MKIKKEDYGFIVFTGTLFLFLIVILCIYWSQPEKEAPFSFINTAHAEFIKPMNPSIIPCDNLTCQSETSERIVKKTLNIPAYSRTTSNGNHNYTRRSTTKFWSFFPRTSRHTKNYQWFLKIRNKK